MFHHNLLLIYRNFRRFKSTFFINLIGLSTGLACTLFIYLWVSDELSVDKFHAYDSRLFLVMTNQNRPESIVTLREGPGLLAEALLQERPEIEYAVTSSGINTDFTLSTKDLHLNAAGQFAENDFFTIFSYPLLEGDRKLVLSDKKSVVISETMARALFGTTTNVIGKVIEWEIHHFTQEARVSGIFKDVPSNSSDQFDFVLPFEVYKDIIGDELHWGNHNAITYLVLKEGTDIDGFNDQITDLVKRHQNDTRLTIFLKRYSENYLYGKYENGKVTGGRIEYVKLFSLIAVFILVIACINFMNLSTARASRRMKEVGIKKAVGAGRKTLVFQYLGESMLLTFVSLLAAIVLVQLFLPQFNIITGKHLTLHRDLKFILSMVGIGLFTGCIAGSYPAVYLSGFKPVAVLKGKLQSSLSELWIRKGLVAFQFALSVIFIVSVLVIYRQIAFVQSKNLGYNKDNVLYFKIEGNLLKQQEAFLSELKAIPGIVNASSMWGSFTGNTGNTTGSFDWEGKDPDEVVQFEHLGINYDMLEMMDIEMAAGRSFSRNFQGDTKGVIMNEAAIDVMRLKDPVGKIFNLWGNDLEIIGVTKNFHFKSLHEKVKPFFFRLMPNDADKIVVRFSAGHEVEAIDKVQELYQKFNPGFPFEYQFVDEDYQAQYVAEKRVGILSRYFAGLAILISCLGLFGLAAFTAERRMKEIGIRKVLGSSVPQIVYLLSGDFTKTVLAAIVIALPVSYWIVSSWLDSFAYKIPLGLWYFLGAGLTALVIAWITVGTQALKAANFNPSQCLKEE